MEGLWDEGDQVSTCEPSLRFCNHSQQLWPLRPRPPPTNLATWNPHPQAHSHSFKDNVKLTPQPPSYQDTTWNPHPHAQSHSHKDNIKPAPTPRYHVEAADNAKFLNVLEKCSHANYLEVLLLVGVDDLLGVHADVFFINTSPEGFSVDWTFIYGNLSFFSLFMGVSGRFQN